MSTMNYITLDETLAQVADPRDARGKRFEWLFLLVVIGAALMSGKRRCLTSKVGTNHTFKAFFRGRKYAYASIELLPEPLPPDIIATIVQHIAAIGAIHATHIAITQP